MIFKNRQQAGKVLAEKLIAKEADLVLAIPRGGVVVAAEISKALKLPLDVVITRKIGSPRQKELALGAVDKDGEIVWDDELKKGFFISDTEVDQAVEKEQQEIKRRENIYRKGKPPIDLKEKAVILVDDGIATGSTVLSAILYLLRHGVEKIILAIPVASEEGLKKLSHEVDQVVLLERSKNLFAIGQFYQQFDPVSDDQVVKLLA